MLQEAKHKIIDGLRVLFKNPYIKDNYFLLTKICNGKIINFYNSNYLGRINVLGFLFYIYICFSGDE